MVHATLRALHVASSASFSPSALCQDEKCQDVVSHGRSKALLLCTSLHGVSRWGMECQFPLCGTPFSVVIVLEPTPYLFTSGR